MRGYEIADKLIQKWNTISKLNKKYRVVKPIQAYTLLGDENEAKLYPDDIPNNRCCHKDFIITWFENHQCNRFCDPKWICPIAQKKDQNVKVTKSSTFVWQTQKQD